MLARLVEQQDLGPGVAGAAEGRAAQLAETARLRALIGLGDEVTPAARKHATGVRLRRARQHGQQRRFPDAVAADERDVLALDPQIQVSEQGSPAGRTDRYR